MDQRCRRDRTASKRQVNTRDLSKRPVTLTAFSALTASEIKPYNLVFFVCGRNATQLISAIAEQIR
jgi:hypothetical protein